MKKFIKLFEVAKKEATTPELQEELNEMVEYFIDEDTEEFIEIDPVDLEQLMEDLEYFISKCDLVQQGIL